MKERVLITGASGFVGYHLILEALKNNLEVFAAVRKSSKIDHLKDLDIQYTYPNFNDPKSLETDLQNNHYNPDRKIHHQLKYQDGHQYQTLRTRVSPRKKIQHRHLTELHL